MSRLNPLHEITEPMNRLERAMSSMRDEMAPIQTLPDVLSSLQRVEALLERLVEIHEAELTGVPIKPAPASRRAAPRKRAASA